MTVVGADSVNLLLGLVLNHTIDFPHCWRCCWRCQVQRFAGTLLFDFALCDVCWCCSVTRQHEGLTPDDDDEDDLGRCVGGCSPEGKRHSLSNDLHEGGTVGRAHHPGRGEHRHVMAGE